MGLKTPQAIQSSDNADRYHDIIRMTIQNICEMSSIYIVIVKDDEIHVGWHTDTLVESHKYLQAVDNAMSMIGATDTHICQWQTDFGDAANMHVSTYIIRRNRRQYTAIPDVDASKNAYLKKLTEWRKSDFDTAFSVTPKWK